MIAPLQHLIQRGRLEQAFINGAWTPAEAVRRVAVINPATEAAIAELALSGDSDARRAVDAAKHAFASWSITSVNTRAELLTRLHQLLLERTEPLAEVLSMEMGAAIQYARTAHVPFAAEHIRVARDNLLEYPFVSQRGATAILREPIGVCGLITPWNWPLYQVTAKVGPALAAGCTVVLKPSELSPLSALLFAELVQEAGFPAGVFNLVNGDGAGVGSALAAHPDVAMISITGSTRAGILVAQAAATTVKRVAQELGGKSPNLILPDADLARAVAPGVAACFRNVGQSCSAPTRMLVPRAQLEEVEALACSAAEEIVVGDPAAAQTTHGPLANQAQFERVQQFIRIGLDEGARLVCGGPGRPEGLQHGFYARPTIFSAVNPEMTIAREEIFGPVLCIIPYDSVEEAVAIANDTVYGLGAHVQSGSIESARAVAAQLCCGQVHLNYPAWDPQAPFGGYKHSGNGREFGVEGLEEYLETKAILGYA
ncbi:MAG: aldehyde dehydrogenase family protein [Gammaproteobacteria bacterium]|nr:aldehyde dehydrogenase family protein [Gammaproteobacteria bacterium]